MLISMQSIFIMIFFAINFAAFLIMLVDKIKSINPNKDRISEGKLFFIAFAFGSLGVYIGMFVCRHKTQKWYFLIGIPLLIIENICTLYVVYLFFV